MTRRNSIFSTRGFMPLARALCPRPVLCSCLAGRLFRAQVDSGGQVGLGSARRGAHDRGGNRPGHDHVTARRWFDLKDDARLTVQHEDARAFLNRQQGQYDLVFVDVFNSHYAVPFQMGTVEAARALRRAVAPGARCS